VLDPDPEKALVMSMFALCHASDGAFQHLLWRTPGWRLPLQKLLLLLILKLLLVKLYLLGLLLPLHFHLVMKFLSLKLLLKSL
jgi:hypothetical protein